MADDDKAVPSVPPADEQPAEPADTTDGTVDRPPARAKASAADKQDDAGASSAPPRARAKPQEKPAVGRARARKDDEPTDESADELADEAAGEPTEEAADEPVAEDAAALQVSGPAGLKLHHLRPSPGAHRPKTRVGRGDASKGKTAGRGTKGTRARDSVSPGFEGGQMPLHRRLPKLKGFSNLRFKITYQVVNTGRLAELYPQGGDVTPEDLVAKGAVRKGELVKVLGAGDVPAGLRVSAHAFSASAKEKITAGGGTITEL